MALTVLQSSAVARATAIGAEFVNLEGSAQILPQSIAVIAQGNDAKSYALEPLRVLSDIEAADAFGFGSPAHLAVRELLPQVGNGVGTIPVTVYPLDADVAGVAAAGDITPTGAGTKQGTFRASVGGIKSNYFVVSVGDTIADVTAKITAAINGVLEMPVIAADNATDVSLTAKWSGASGNGIVVSIEGPTDTGVTLAITQPTGGAVNPDIQAALDMFGSVKWETLILNTMNADDEDALDALSVFGEARWEPLDHRPFVAVVGNTDETVTEAITVTDTRKTDRVNCQVVNPGSEDLPFVVAAAELAKIAVTANERPARDYGSQVCSSLEPGPDTVQWDYTERDTAIKGGSSTIEIKNGMVSMSDILTMFHPDGVLFPAYRFVVNIMKLMNIIHNLNLVFDSEEWDGAPLVNDVDEVDEPTAKRPRDAKTEIYAIIDYLVSKAIIVDADFCKRNVTVTIDDQNPDRLNIRMLVKLSGNTRQKPISLGFGYNLGSAA